MFPVGDLEQLRGLFVLEHEILVILDRHHFKLLCDRAGNRSLLGYGPAGVRSVPTLVLLLLDLALVVLVEVGSPLCGIPVLVKVVPCERPCFVAR